MRAAALVLALLTPLPVTSVNVVANVDGSVTLFWTLPADPSVAGVTVFRERLDVFEPEIQFTLGLDPSLTDFSLAINGAYRYWVHTRDEFGNLSVGVFVEVFPANGPVFVDTTSSGSWFVCSGSSAAGSPLLPLGLSVVAISSLVVLHRARSARRFRNRSP